MNRKSSNQMPNQLRCEGISLQNMVFQRRLFEKRISYENKWLYSQLYKIRIFLRGRGNPFRNDLGVTKYLWKWSDEPQK